MASTLIEKRTVLVLGAGSSKPYGLPLGFELRDAVLAEGVWVPLDRPGHMDPDPESGEFCRDLAESGFASVDAFLEQRPRWTEVGKRAMALQLLELESKASAKLFPPRQPKDHWYEVLWSRIAAPSWSAFKRQPLRIITFNYDRSLEHYLARVICNNYRLRLATALGGLSVLHVHGSLGPYEESFGRPPIDATWAEAANAIRVVHEAETQDAGFVQARRWLGEAETVLFIGFGYHEANMRKLGYETHASRVNRPGTQLIAGTHKGIHRREWDKLCRSYGFSHQAGTRGGGLISPFLAESLR
jgi:hypothetical protein